MTIEVENIGANNIDSSLSSALDENSIYKTTFKEYEIVSAPKIQSTLLTTDKIIYSVRVSGNEKDFSEDADIPTELKVLSDSIRNSGSNTIASYIIAMQIAKNVK